MGRKDRLFFLFTLLLSLLAGMAGAFSVSRPEIQRTVYRVLDMRTSRTFEFSTLTRNAAELENLMDPGKIRLSGTVREKAEGEEALPYVHLATREVLGLRPYFSQFFRGFVFVWIIYLIVDYLLRHLVIREYRENLNRRRGGGGRKKK